MRGFVGVMLLLGLLAPNAADAQRRTSSSCCRGNPFSFSPYAGMYKDAYDAEADGSDLGWLIGFKAGYELGDRVTAFANLAYAEANDVATRGITSAIVDNLWVLLTGGADFILVPGANSIAVGGEAGVAWRKTPVRSGTVEFDDDSWSSLEVLVPSVTFRHQFSQRTGLWVSGRDYIMDVFEGPSEHSLALVLGLSFR